MFNKTYRQDEFIELKNITLDYNYNQILLVQNFCFLNYFNRYVSFTVTYYFSFKTSLNTSYFIFQLFLLSEKYQR